MNIHRAVKSYINKMLSLVDGGMKVLMLDQETSKIVSVVSSMSEIMKQDVYLVECIDSAREPLEQLRCVCFLRPTNDNVNLLVQELRKPNYFSYYIFFSHSLTKHLLKQLAEADENELVVEVREYFADYIPLSPFLFQLDIPISYNASLDMNQRALNRATEGLTSVFISLKKCPIIRYQNASQACRQLAESVRSTMSRETVLFDFRQVDPMPVLLILDRRQDSVTPLLTQWTYEAMVHELIGIVQNRVSLLRAPNVRTELKEITLDREFDEFYRANQYANFGEIGLAIRKLVEEFQKASKSVDTKNLDSISDLKKFLENYPSFRKASGTVETHVAVVSELSRIVKERALLELSEIEQELICRDNHSAIITRIRSLVNDPRILLSDALRIVLLYSLRYENQKEELSGLIKSISARGVTSDDIGLISKLTTFSWPRFHSDGFELFSVVKNAATGVGNADAPSATKAMASLKKRLVQGLRGVDNVYTQHEPLLVEIMNNLIKGQLKETSFPILVAGSSWKSIPSGLRPKEIIVFVIGGVTYEEAFCVHRFNRTTPDVDIVLGGTCVHNSRSFLAELEAVCKNTGPTIQTSSSGTINYPSEHTHKGLGKTRSNIRYSLIQ